MNSKTVSLSVRVSEEDAEYISQLQISGASTPSDKLRALIRDARLRNEGRGDYKGWLRIIEDISGSAAVQLRELEREAGLHSPLVLEALGSLQESLAFALSELLSTEEVEAKELLASLEAGILDRLFALLESLMRQGITKESRCYRPTAIAERLDTVLELANVIATTRKS